MPNPCSNLGCYILALSPSTVSEETALVVRPFQAAIVLGRMNFLNRPYTQVDGGTYKGMGPACSRAPSTDLR